MLEEDLDDTHLCIKCSTTIVGLDNYVQHRKTNCGGKTSRATIVAGYGGFEYPDASSYAKSEVETTGGKTSKALSDPYDLPYELGADVFFSSLQLQSVQATGGGGGGGKINSTQQVLTRKATATLLSAGRDEAEGDWQEQARKNTDNLMKVVRDIGETKKFEPVFKPIAFTHESPEPEQSDDEDDDDMDFEDDDDDEDYVPTPYSGGKWKPGSQPPPRSGGKWKGKSQSTPTGGKYNFRMAVTEDSKWKPYRKAVPATVSKAIPEKRSRRLSQNRTKLKTSGKYTAKEAANGLEYPEVPETGGKWKPGFPKLPVGGKWKSSDGQESPEVLEAETGGKWKPGFPKLPIGGKWKSSDGQESPEVLEAETGGKWKPGCSKTSKRPAPPLTGGKWKSSEGHESPVILETQTGGKWKPEEGSTGGKWKPGDGPTGGKWNPEDSATEGKSIPDDGLTEGKWKPEDGPTGGKWKLGDGPTGDKWEQGDGLTGGKWKPRDDPMGDKWKPEVGPTGGKWKPGDGPTGDKWKPEAKSILEDGPTGGKWNPKNGPIGDTWKPEDGSTGVQWKPEDTSTGGKWKPEYGPTSSKWKPGNGPTGGKWKPGDGPTGGKWKPEDSATEGKSIPEDGLTEGKWKPEDGPTGGKWKPGDGPTGGKWKPGDGPTGGKWKPGDSATEVKSIPEDVLTKGKWKPEDGPTGGEWKPEVGPIGGKWKPGEGPTGGEWEPKDSLTEGELKPGDEPTGGKSKPENGPTEDKSKPEDGPAGAKWNPKDGSTGGKWKPEDGPTGGKWKPEDVTEDGKWNPEDGPTKDGLTSGKWKPGERETNPTAWRDQKQAGDSHPPVEHTKGKWVPGTKDKKARKHKKKVRKAQAEFWCNICCRKLTTKTIYEKHLKSGVHLWKSETEQQLERAVSQQLPRPPPVLLKREASPKPDPSKRQRRKTFIKCGTCKHRMQKCIVGKHLISHYHYVRMTLNPEGSYGMIFDNIHQIVLQSPFQCTPCRFYANTEENFLNHWNSVEHRDRTEGPGKFWCSFCHFECEDNNQMRRHLLGTEHREVILAINRSVPICISKKVTIECPKCHQGFRFNMELRQHALRCDGAKTAPIGTASDEYQSLYRCELCPEDVFKSVVALQRHAKFKHNVEQFHCSVCKLDFESASEAVKHRKTKSHRLKSAEKLGKPKRETNTSSEISDDLQCEQCDHVSSSEVEAMLHQITHHDGCKKDKEKPSVEDEPVKDEPNDNITRKCPLCKKIFNTKRELKTHLNTVHPESKHICPVCGESFTLTQELCSHRRYNVCVASTSRQQPPSASSPRKEKTTTALKKSWTCSDCTFSSAYESELIFHRIIHTEGLEALQTPTKLNCPLCEKSFAKHSLRQHLRQHTNEKTFTCEICNRSFSRRHNYKEHMQYVHSVGGVKKRKKNDADESFICDTCGKIFRTKYSLKVHINSHGERDKRFQCPVENCPYIACNKQALGLHGKTHTTKKSEFSCEEIGCKYQGKSAYHLKRHMKIHAEPNKVYKCPECDFKAKVPGHMRRHRRIHTGECPYRCPHCEYTTGYIENLRKHVLTTKKHTGKSIYECDRCDPAGKQFKSNYKNEYELHFATEHAE